jgi:hypothetical protein
MIIFGYLPGKQGDHLGTHPPWQEAAREHQAENQFYADLESCPSAALIHFLDSNVLPDFIAKAAARELSFVSVRSRGGSPALPARCGERSQSRWTRRRRGVDQGGGVLGAAQYAGRWDRSLQHYDTNLSRWSR